jgi:anti-sigma regulatory factor (Ser/Thr protein kinase)
MGAEATTIVLEADASQVAPARRFVRRMLADATDPATLSDLQLIVSELFTNAVEHGVDGTVRVVVHDTPHFVGVTVQSRGPAPQVGEASEWHVAAPTAVSGRGLGIVRELADEVIVERVGDDLFVTARRANHDRVTCTAD